MILAINLHTDIDTMDATTDLMYTAAEDHLFVSFGEVLALALVGIIMADGNHVLCVYDVRL